MKSKWRLGILGLGIWAAAAVSVSGATRGIGLGAVVGDPTGISAKVWQGRTNSINGIVGWSFRSDYLHLVADYVWHNYSLIPVTSGQFPVYYGMGAGVVVANNPGAGIRMVAGLEYLFPSAPLDVFLEVAPVAVILPGADIAVNAGIGMRFFF